MDRLRRTSPYLLGAVLTTTGVLHLLVPKPYDGLIPSWLPGSARAWVYGSGVAELACAAGLFVPRTRRPAATATALLFVAVFPGNIEMAVHPGDTPRWLALARLPLQIPLLLWALQVRRVSAGDGR
ncbi:MAG: DoxX family protein [Actinobacteria bacterium]|nr:DoxX family protein [Actinomycetota bacterium]